ncbi:hypothetical protein [Roseiarcus sp.]|uniref:hypothetical protein n=1 Tax=Roseiarcus sp. TaxID=1969460 RepID=UPI003F960D79
MSSAILRIVYVVLIVAAGALPAHAMGGGGPPAWTMTLNYCRQTVANKGITDVTKFDEEVKKCFADPVSYPPAYSRPRW